ncbi:uncharacterized protein [Branchiostoma lanceolatum]|uniref:uncharacterized protein isoform X2 n=1 Tax=Branchiostoma lanceolatum TaxID=7740 RepID=UPI00345153B4
MAQVKDDVLLFAHPSMEALADDVAEKCRQLVQTGKQTQVQSVQVKRTIRWGKFPDDFPNLFIDNVKECVSRDVVFLASFHSPDVIFEQLSVLYAVPKYLARSFTVILPYFPTGTMERVDTEGQIATAKTLATLLSAIPLTARGPTKVVIYDIHSLPLRFYFSDNIIPRLESAIPLIQRELLLLPDKSKVAVAFPDEGAWKRFHLMFEDRFPLVTCTKVREDDQRHVTVKEGDPKGRHVVIVDDLVMTGGTLKECAKVLLAQGAEKISAYVTHPVFPHDSWKLFTQSDVAFENFWITDSVPHARQITQHPPFKLLPLADVISEGLLGLSFVSH